MADTNRRFKVVFAGLQSVQRYKKWRNHPFAQLGAEMVITPLTPAAAQELIIRPFRSLGFAFDNTTLVLRILSLANYHPGLIQIFCYRLLERLYDKWQHQDSASTTPIRPILHDDVMYIERDESIREDIRNRFDWTLDLDDRYKALTYALVLTSNPSDPRLESDFMGAGTRVVASCVRQDGFTRASRGPRRDGWPRCLDQRPGRSLHDPLSATQPELIETAGTRGRY